MPNSALGNLIEAATIAIFKILSVVRIIPIEIIKCAILNA